MSYNKNLHRWFPLVPGLVNMAMLDVSCDNCGRQFRVRAEFAGKSTRCPGCSKPLGIGSPTKSAPPPLREDYDDAPRPRRRAEKTKNIGVSEEWQKALSAFGKEQAAVRFLGVQVLADLVAFCLLRGAGSFGGMPTLLLVLFLLLFVGPALMAVIMGISARVGILNLPAEAKTSGSAWSSTICSLGGLFAVLLLGLAFLLSIDGNRRNSEPLLLLSITAGFLMTGGAIVSFAIVVAQVGIATGAKEISGAIGRMAIGMTVCVLLTMLLGGCISAANGAFTTRGNPSFSGGPSIEPFVALGGFSMLITSIVMLVFYHSLLTHAKKALQNTGVP